eukprot:164765_1
MASSFVIIISSIILAKSTVTQMQYSPTKAHAYVNDCMTWNGAMNYCSNTLNGELASAHLPEERAFIIDMIDRAPTGTCTGWLLGQGIWLGGNHNGSPSRPFSTTSVEWFDGTVTPFSDLIWDFLEPN